MTATKTINNGGQKMKNAVIRKSLTGKLHLTYGINAAFCSAGNRGLRTEAKVSAKNALMFPIDSFCRKCFPNDPLRYINIMIKNNAID